MNNLAFVGLVEIAELGMMCLTAIVISAIFAKAAVKKKEAKHECKCLSEYGEEEEGKSSC